MLRADGSKACVLVVNPSAHMRRLIITLMGALGVRSCSEARLPAQAVAQVIKSPPDLIILDLGGDSTDALLFVHRLRRGELGCADIPVMGISPSTHHAVLELAWESGITDVVSPPISAIEMIQRAGALLEEAARDKKAVPTRSTAAE